MLNKKITVQILVVFVPFLSLTCKNSTEPDLFEPFPGIQILNNSNVEEGSGSPNNWLFWPSSNQSYSGARTRDQAFSASQSLRIHSNHITTTSGSFWAQTIVSDIPVGKSLTLKAWIKLENVVGKGIALAVRGDNTTAPTDSAEVFSSTEENIVISGTEDTWIPYTVTLPAVPADIKSIVVYLLFLPETSGTVYFDDITLHAK